MAQFDESKVINTLHPEKAEVGKKYWYSDNLKSLKRHIEDNDTDCIGELGCIEDEDTYIFYVLGRGNWELLYPYEEPKEQRMTNRQLSEWLAKGNGECKHLSSESMGIFTYSAYLGESNNECLLDLRIRTWDSDEWVEPTLDIYLRDCKHLSQDEFDYVADRDGC